MKTPLAALAAALILAVPLGASAQEVPSYADSGQQDQQIRGRIANFDGGYNVQVRDDQGYVDNVQLHDGTIINPTGLTLAPGMVVSILGYNSGSYFAANEIDTPYTFDAGVPYYSGHPWGYYGSSFSLDFFFGNAGWWHGDDFGGGYRYDRGVRIYNDVHVRNVYQNGGYGGYGSNGGYRGHNAVSPSGGGYDGGYNRGYNRPYTHNQSYAPQQSLPRYAPQVRPGGYTPGHASEYGRANGGGFNRPSNGNANGGGFARPSNGNFNGGGFARPSNGNVGGGFHDGGARVAPQARGGEAPRGGSGGNADHGGDRHH